MSLVYKSVDGCSELQTNLEFYTGKYGKFTDDDVVFYYRGYGFYEGAWFLLLERGSELFEDRGEHCSCYGYDNLDPEPTNWPALISELGNLNPQDHWRFPINYSDSEDVEARDALIALLRAKAAELGIEVPPNE